MADQQSQRPRGLKRSKAAEADAESKRPREEVAEDADAGDQVELSIPLDEDGKPIDEIQEAHTIYETAVASLNDGKVDEAKTLLQGAIHEYDRFMRQRSEEDRNSEFYRYYGDALRELGGIRQEAEFVEAALLRYDTALELNSHNVKALHSRAKAQLDLASYVPPSDSAAVVARAQEAMAALRKATALVDDARERARMIGQFGQILSELADRADDVDTAVLQLAQDAFAEALTEDADCEAALAGQGLTYITQTSLVIAAGRTENGEDDDEEEQPLTDEAKAEETEHIAKAVASLTRALELVEAAKTTSDNDDEETVTQTRARYLCWLAEAQMLQYELNDDIATYEAAIESLKRADAIDPTSLSEPLRELLEEWTANQQEEEEASDNAE